MSIVDPMRADWTRQTPLLELGVAELEKLVEPAFAGQRVVRFATAEGGLANTNIKVWLSNRERPVLLRLAIRDPRQAEKEASLHNLVAGRVPIAPLLHFSSTNPVSGHPYLILEWVDGERLDGVAARVPTRQIGASVGRCLAGIHSFEFAEPGFLDHELRVTERTSMGHEGLVAYLRECLLNGLGRERVGDEDTARILSFAEEHGFVLEEWSGGARLVHGDFGGSNILVGAHQEEPGVTAVLDWEFALSGSPAIDFGNVLRPPLGNSAEFCLGLERGYVEAGVELPSRWRTIARVIDLFAWAYFLSSPNPGATLIADARQVLRDTIDSVEGTLP